VEIKKEESSGSSRKKKSSEDRLKALEAMEASANTARYDLILLGFYFTLLLRIISTNITNH
jgi:hypothetical protein